ncbi:hypothetical protein CAPTEDRAFT_219196 [Capitella teleta]|uniref:Small monomeric GTPase n=1 Tax=Capitella teleta TaxID=283909 RepID=R7TYH6_CAPTE|nr:hypothetical protein CAPTEDRAFT_219196 [Capitella teleta]|eukprot:ELT98958.1 hypothetical protein CAPTEDRAFT_219196 [Capitella teleta]
MPNRTTMPVADLRGSTPYFDAPVVRRRTKSSTSDKNRRSIGSFPVTKDDVSRDTNNVVLKGIRRKTSDSRVCEVNVAASIPPPIPTNDHNGVVLRRHSNNGSPSSPFKDMWKRLSWRSKKKSAEQAERKRPHSFVNSQEWTISRTVGDLKLGILGTTNSGKSALVHRYLTGSYMQEESPEGGRFKKEVLLDGQSYLLLIRDEGGPPEMQFTHWVDAVIFVFSLENELSFNAIYSFYAKMAHYRNIHDLPIILVGTQDSISESRPRVIDDTRARKLASDLKRCSYYETCATYGLNVERVFQDACQKIAALHSITPTNSRPSTPSGHLVPIGAPSSRMSDNSSQSGSAPNVAQGHSPPFREPHKDSKELKKHRQGDHKQHGVAVPVPIPQPPSIPPPPIPGAEDSSSIAPMLSASLPSRDMTSTPQQRVLKSWGYRTMGEYRERENLPTPSSTPILSRKHHHKQAKGLSKSNSFSGPAVLRQGPLPPTPPQNSGGGTTPSSTPVLSRKHKNNKSFIGPESPPPSPSLHARQLGLDDQRYRFSLIVERMDSLMRDFAEPLTPVLSRRVKGRNITAVPLENGNAVGETVAGTPTGTPTQSRKNRRRSNLFTQKNKAVVGEEEKKVKNGEVGSGRVIPVKQGYLYKKSGKPINKDWKKKYVTLLDDGRLTYHPSLHDYMDDVHGKEITLVRTTVKIPGQRPRAAIRSSSDSGGQNSTAPTTVAGGKQGLLNKVHDKENVLLTAFDDGGAVVIPNASLNPPDGDPALLHDDFPPGSAPPPPQTPGSKIETPNVKKRHKRAKSSAKNLDNSQDADSDGYEFVIVSLDNKQWHFEAQSIDEREDWVLAIEQQILCSLQMNESNKSKNRSNTDPGSAQAIRLTKGNNICADCDAPNPDWASLNLGAVVCIECSGIHRNLGTHLSRVRSLDLDDWPGELVQVMTCIGNHVANSIWECNTKGRPKPTPSSPRDDKERYIRAKYERKEFLPALPYLDVPIPQQLIDAIARQDVHSTILVLAYCIPEYINAPYSQNDTRTAVHIASALGNVVHVQLLLWYGANVRMVDHEGRNALWYARSSGSQECVDLLRAQGCSDNPTLPRRRPQAPPPGGNNGNGNEFEKLPASVI